MLGYNLLGYSSVMELDRHQAQIIVPVLTMSLSSSPPAAVVGGASISPPTVVMSNTNDTAAIRGGSYVPAPQDLVFLIPQVPGISISANIYPPTTPVEYIPQTPSVWAGAQVQIGYKIMDLSIFDPFVTAGKSIFHPPVVQVDFVPYPPGISISANIYPPLKALAFKPFAPEKVGGGTLIEVGIVDVQYDLGGIGDTLIGEFSIGEGRVITKTVNKVFLLNMLAFAPEDIQGGAYIELPEAVTMQLIMQTAEIDSRRRKLRAQVILS